MEMIKRRGLIILAASATHFLHHSTSHVFAQTTISYLSSFAMIETKIKSNKNMIL